jgi:16S rRNA (uracil1498-N3)-methyltransferase
VGDTFEVTDGLGTLASAELTSDEKRNAGFRIIESHKIPRRPYSIHLAIAPTKNIDRMEWLVEKCTEIGVDKITFVRCKTSERPSVPLERLQKLVLSAMKQSKQAWLPDVRDMVTFKDFLSTVTEEQRFIAYVDNNNPDQLFDVAKPGKNSVLMIGPEGDFNAEELSLALAAGFRKVSLGPNRLRTETAGLFGVSTLNLKNTGT